MTFVDIPFPLQHHDQVRQGARNSVLRLLIEILILIPGSAVVGFSIGTAQHIVAFGVWGYGFGSEAIRLAAFEGGLIGAFFGVFTGIVTYYAALRRNVDARIIAYTIGGSLVGGCLLGVVFFWGSAFLTPFLTFYIAHRIRRTSATNIEQLA